MDMDEIYSKLDRPIDHGLVPNVDEILMRSDNSAITFLYSLIKEQGYVTVGEYLQKLQDEDLEILLEYCDIIIDQGETHERYDEAYRNMILITLGLAMGECISLSEESVVKAMQIATVLIPIESLYRKGLIDAFHSNMSIGPEFGDKMIARKKL